jgi:hypothetical protein
MGKNRNTGKPLGEMVDPYTFGYFLNAVDLNTIQIKKCTTTRK